MDSREPPSTSLTAAAAVEGIDAEQESQKADATARIHQLPGKEKLITVVVGNALSKSSCKGMGG
jgi:hypothetical protein